MLKKEIVHDGHICRLASDDPLMDVAEILSNISIKNYSRSGPVRIVNVECDEYWIEVTLRMFEDRTPVEVVKHDKDN